MKYRKKMNDLNELYCLHRQSKAFPPDKPSSDEDYFPGKAIFNIYPAPYLKKSIKIAILTNYSTPQPTPNSLKAPNFAELSMNLNEYGKN